MAATTYRLIITADSPLSFSRRKPGGIFQQSLPYIPGSALRGAVAASLLKGAMKDHLVEKHHLPQNDCAFCQMFLDPEAAVFTNAYPAKHEYTSGNGATAAVSGPYVLPATAVSCKRYNGFIADEKTHGVFDTLVERLCWETLSPPALIYSPNCGTCRERVEPYSAVFVRQPDGRYRSQKISQRLLTRVAINRRRAVAEDGLLFSPWVIEEVVKESSQKDGKDDNCPEESKTTTYQPTRFVGHLHFADETLAETLKTVTAVGGRVSRGLNHVQIEVEAVEPEDARTIQNRIVALNNRIEEAWFLYRQLGGSQIDKTGAYFTVDLQAEAILQTIDGRPTMVLEAELLSRATGGAISGDAVRLVRSYATYSYIGGWHSAWKLPKPTAVSVQQGAVYLFHAPDGLDRTQLQALARLQQSGIGERQTEGYGQVRICDEFHLVPREQPV